MSIVSFNLPDGGIYGNAVRVMFLGRLKADGADQRISLSMDSILSGYFSLVSGSYVDVNGNTATFVESQADSVLPQRPGIYVGRTGWSTDAHFSIDVTIAIANSDVASETRLMVSGQSIFTFAQPCLITYTFGGSVKGLPKFTHANPLRSVQFTANSTIEPVNSIIRVI
jgi:hypothetical protein